MNALSFRTRLTLRWTAAFGLLLAAVNVAVYTGIRTFLERDLDAQLRTLAGTELASAVDTDPLHIHDFPGEAFADQAAAEKFAQIATRDGRVLVQSAALGDAPPLVSAAGVRAADGGEAPISSVTVLNRPARMIALETDNHGQRLIVAVGVFTDRLQATLVRLVWLLAGVWVVGLGATALIGSAIASRALAPIGRITRRAAAIARGDLPARLDPPAVDDEIGRMTRLLNEMLERLDGALTANRRFAADASHELRGPLTAMLGELDVTLKRTRTAAEYHETLEVVRAQIQDVVALADNLMLLVRAQEGYVRIGEVPLVPLLRRVAAPAERAAAARGITVRITDVPDLVVYGDEALLARAFGNLLQNAVKYNRDGGLVDVTARFEEAGGGWRSATAVIDIRDTGGGIADTERERVFERFYRTDRSRARHTGGTGLGLAICREVLVLFGGTVRVRDSSPEGTTFEVRLPGERRSAGVSAALQKSS